MSTDLSLAEHHLYGSSRLGLKTYWPEEISYHWEKNSNSLITNSVLSQRSMWYSSYLQDLIPPHIMKDYPEKADIDQNTPYIFSHVLGQKQYELSNHLGNVQMVILDKLYAKPTSASPIHGESAVSYKSVVNFAADYYPFGMQMPGRVAEANQSQCMDVVKQSLVKQETRVFHSYDVAEKSAVMSFPFDMYNGHNVIYNNGAQSVTANNWRIQMPTSTQDHMSIDLTDETAIPEIYIPLQIDSMRGEYEFGFEMHAYDHDHNETENPGIQYEILEFTDSSLGMNASSVIYSQMSMEPTQNIQFGYNKPNAQTRYALRVVVPERGHITQLNPLGWWETKITYTVQNVSTTVCNTGSAYRFGFNGQEKDNEIKGVGNSYDFGARIYDPRLGKFLNVDPLKEKYPWQSAYSYSFNNPNFFIDFEGKGGKAFKTVDANGKPVIKVQATIYVYSKTLSTAEVANACKTMKSNMEQQWNNPVETVNENGGRVPAKSNYKFDINVVPVSQEKAYKLADEAHENNDYTKNFVQLYEGLGEVTRGDNFAVIGTQDVYGNNSTSAHMLGHLLGYVYDGKLKGLRDEYKFKDDGGEDKIGDELHANTETETFFMMSQVRDIIKLSQRKVNYKEILRLSNYKKDKNNMPQLGTVNHIDSRRPGISIELGSGTNSSEEIKHKFEEVAPNK